MRASAMQSVLLVDDDPWLGAELAQLLAQAGPIQTVVRPTSASAWAWLMTHPAPALIVIDYHLGLHDFGEDLARRLLHEPRLAEVPRIAYSQAAMPTPTLFAACLQKGHDHRPLVALVVRLCGLQGGRAM